MVSGALLFSAQAAELPSAAKDTLQSAMTKVQQEIKDYGQVKTLGFTGENCEIILSNLNAKQYLVNLTADSTHKYGILDKATGNDSSSDDSDDEDEEKKNEIKTNQAEAAQLQKQLDQYESQLKDVEKDLAAAKKARPD